MAIVELNCNKLSIYPIGSFIGGVSTVLLTTIVWFSFEHFNEGWVWPPISLVGREVPSFYIFATGFTITCMFLIKFSFVYIEYLNKLEIKLLGSILPDNVWKWRAQVCCSIGGLNLALLALTNHRDLWYEGILPHIITTLLMFFSSLVGCISGYKALLFIRNNVKKNNKKKNRKKEDDLIEYLDYIIKIKRRIVILLAIAVGIHVPCGYIVPVFACRGTNVPISMENCTKVYKLSNEYCNAWQDKNDPSMTRFNYNNCGGWLTLGKYYRY